MTDFQNRLAKVYKHISKWARRQEITCFRIYDQDVPGFPFSIDKYEDLIYVAWYHKPHTRTPKEQEVWLDDCLKIISETLDVPIQNIFLKERRKQKGTEQYIKLSDRKNTRIVTENGLKFLVNLSDYLDTGLFLDHRNTRQMARDKANGKNTLNLFAYTGSFSVYMAAGGATKITTVDLSKTYLNWAEENMALNGFSGKTHEHTLLHADVKSFLKQYQSQPFELIVMDPPTFSNSKRMSDILDIQRDHVELLNDALNLCSAQAEIIFSTNYRGFKMDTQHLNCKNIEEISHLTIPNDFRNKKIHKCYLLTK